MHRFIVEENLVVNNVVTLKDAEHSHLQVLRLKVSDIVELINGDGFFYIAEITEIGKKQTLLIVKKKRKDEGVAKNRLTVFMNLIRADKMDFVAQKLTELNVSELVPFESRFITAKDRGGKTDRLIKISKEACKQCGRADFLKIGKTLTFEELLKNLKGFDRVLLAYENAEMPLARIITKKMGINTALIVGSEGGFSKDEVVALENAGAKVISLGKRILRAETAAVSFVSMVQLLLGELE